MDDWHDTLAVLEDSIGTYCVPMTGEHAKSVAKMPAHIKQALDNGGEALLNIADRLEPGLRLQWLSAAVDVRNTADLERIAEAFMSGHMTEMEAAAALQDLQNMGDNIDPILKQGFLQGATAAAELIGLSEAQVSLSLVNEAAVSWASTRAAEMVTVSTDSAKDLIRLVVANGIERGDHPSVVARLIRDVVGLNAQQGEAVDAFYQDMLDRGLSEEDALARTDKYSVAKLRERATMIARTEAITSLNKGQEAYWEQAMMKGFLNPDVTRRVWIASDDDKTCDDICLPLDGEETTLDEPWVIPDGPNQGEEVDSPGMDAHPHCRCTEGLVFHRDTVDENAPADEAPPEDVLPIDETPPPDEEAGIGQVIAKYNPDEPREPAGSPEGGQWIGSGSWKNSSPKLASDIAGKTPDTPITTKTLYHVTRVENVEGIIRNGFDITKVEPRWQNDYAISFSAGSAAQAAAYFASRGKPMDETKYALLKAKVRGRFADADDSPVPRATSPRDYTRQLIGTGHDGLDAGGSVYVHNPRAILSVEHVKVPANKGDDKSLKFNPDEPRSSTRRRSMTSGPDKLSIPLVRFDFPRGASAEEVALDLLVLAARHAKDAQVKYSDDEPRVPAGSPEGGQWTSGGSGGSATPSELVTRLAALGPGAFTVQSDSPPGEGAFGVSLAGHETVLTDAQVTPQAIVSYAAAHADQLAEPNTYLSAWHDVRHAKTTLDVIKIVDNEHDAMRQSLDGQQFAYFDFATREVVPTSRRAHDFPQVGEELNWMQSFNATTQSEPLPSAPHLRAFKQLVEQGYKCYTNIPKEASNVECQAAPDEDARRPGGQAQGRPGPLPSAHGQGADSRGHRGSQAGARKASLAPFYHVYRPVVNSLALEAWALAHGVVGIVPPVSMRVTVALSRTAPHIQRDSAPIEVIPCASEEVNGALAIGVWSDDLAARHQAFADAGATWDWEPYHPLIYLSYEPQTPPVAVPTFPVRLGPEVGEQLTLMVSKGGPGSGDPGHAGRPGQVGGSIPGPGSGPHHQSQRGQRHLPGMAPPDPRGPGHRRQPVQGPPAPPADQHTNSPATGPASEDRPVLPREPISEANDRTTPPSGDLSVTEALNSSKVSSVKDLGGGVNLTQVVTLENGMKGVWKPAAMDNGGIHMRGQRMESALREAAAYDVAVTVDRGLDQLVPPTIIRTIDGQKGSLQLFVADSTTANRAKQDWKNPNGLFEAERQQAIVFDYVIGSSDRHMNNWMVDKDGHIHLIDNGFSLSGPPSSSAIKLDNKALAIPAAVKKAWTESWPKVAAALKAAGIEESQITGAKGRMDFATAPRRTFAQLKMDRRY